MRILGRLIIILLFVALVGGLVWWRAPLWLIQQGTHTQLLLARVQSNYVLTPEGRVHYYEGEARIPGGGIPLVLVHGLGDRGESWAPLLIRLKRAGFHVYAPDLLGYGRSPAPASGDYSMAGEAKFVYDFIQALGLQRTDVAGWSMGGWVTLRLAHEHPELIDRVVVMDSAGIKFQPTYNMSVFTPASSDDIAQMWSLLEPEAKPLPAHIERDAARRLSGVRATVEKNVAAMVAGKEFVDSDLQTLPEPLLMIWGSTDKLLPLALGRLMHVLDSKSELDIVEGCGHLAPGLCAARVAPAVADFLKSEPPPQGGVRTLANMRR